MIIAAYRPRDGFLRVIRSLDAQTLPQDEFETIVIDDGSPDDTFERLQRHAATRPNMRVRRIENSGWPSRPRNLAIEMARGDHLLFMDHDDSLYPEALERAAAYAAETAADLLSPKESKTSDVWWGMPALQHGNLPNALESAGIEALLPLVPHKFYRREFLLEHGIRFPEGRRMLWEDIYVNVEVWRHARHVAVLADTPVYLWHSSATNNSKTYGPRSVEYWDRLDELVAFVDRTLDAPGHEDARRWLLLHLYRGRVLGRLSRMLAGSTSEERSRALARAQRIRERHVPRAWIDELGLWERAREVLVESGRSDLLERLAAIDAAVTSSVEVERLAWVDGRLRMTVRGTFATRDGRPLALRREGDRVVRILPEEIAAALPPDLLDVTDRLDGFGLSVGVRHRRDRVTWELPHEPTVAFEPLDEEGVVTAVARSVVDVDLDHAAMGAPLSDWVWDTYGAIRWEGLSRGTRMRYHGPARAALAAGRAAVAYRGTSGNLTLDTAGRLRNVVKDSRPQVGDLAATPHGLVVTLPHVAVTGTTRLPAMVVLAPLDGGEDLELPGAVVGGPDGARLETTGEVRPGRYRLAFAVGGGGPLPSAFVAHVDEEGAVEIVRRPLDPPRERRIDQVRVWVRRTWRRGAATARAAARRVRSRR